MDLVTKVAVGFLGLVLLGFIWWVASSAVRERRQAKAAVWAWKQTTQVLHSEITRKRITAPSIVADQGPGQMGLAPEGTSDRSDHVDSADQHGRGQQPPDRRDRQRQHNQPQPAVSLSRSVASFP